MIQQKLTELGKLMDENPTSPQLLILASEIKSACATPDEEQLVEAFVGSRLPELDYDIGQLHDCVAPLQRGEADGT